MAKKDTPPTPGPPVPMQERINSDIILPGESGITIKAPGEKPVKLSTLLAIHLEREESE